MNDDDAEYPFHWHPLNAPHKKKKRKKRKLLSCKAKKWKRKGITSYEHKLKIKDTLSLPRHCSETERLNSKSLSISFAFFVLSFSFWSPNFSSLFLSHSHLL